MKIAHDLRCTLHNYLCEITPELCEDSGLPEWSGKELDKLIDVFLEILENYGYGKLEV